jgi:hypothetical protein
MLRQTQLGLLAILYCALWHHAAPRLNKLLPAAVLWPCTYNRTRYAAGLACANGSQIVVIYSHMGINEVAKSSPCMVLKASTTAC